MCGSPFFALKTGEFSTRKVTLHKNLFHFIPSFAIVCSFWKISLKMTFFWRNCRIMENDMSRRKVLRLTLAGHPCAGPSGCQDHPHPRDDGQRLCGGPPESSCGGHDRTSDQAAGPGQRLPDAGEVLPESGMNLPPDFTTLPKHDKVKILCPSSKKDTSGGGESRRESTQHDTASQPRTERMLLQWNRAKRPLI